jgi:poly(A) polymerase
MMTREQWDALLIRKDADKGLEALYQSGMLVTVFPALATLVGFGGGDSGHKDLWAHTKSVVIQTLPDPVLRWAALFHDVGKPVSFTDKGGKISFHMHEHMSGKIFRMAARHSGMFTTEEIDRINFILENLGKVEGYHSEWTDSAVRRLAHDLGAGLEDVFAVARADCTTGNSAKRKRIMQLSSELRERVRTIQAADATPPALPKGLGIALQAALGIQDNRELGPIMASLRSGVESGELPRNADHETYINALRAT